MNRTKSMRLLAMVVAMVLMAALSARAQVTTGSVAGTVTDAQGGVIPGATVILTNTAQGTKSTPVVTNSTGDFTIPNVPSGTYTLDVTMPSFKNYKRSGVTVSAGSPTSLGTLALEVGGASETVDVKAVSPVIQATTGERSFTVSTESVESLPIASRSFIGLALLAPGMSGTVAAPVRTGGGGDTNIMMDGVSVMDTGSNRPLLQMNVESISEVKVLTSSYQAEYGRSSGVQITAVTKSGTNRFRGSVYDVQRNSDWNTNSKQNKLNGVGKAITKEKDWGFSIGGPVGKPGGNNKIFFFYAQEFEPRTAGNDVRSFRFPTALERAGDFSQTLDNNGALYNAIKDPLLNGACTLTDNTACFADGGIKGKIPANRLYGVGLNVLNMYPMPNCPGPTCPTWIPTSNFNYQITRPTESILAYQPGLRFDYQPSQNLRVGVKYSGWQQRSQQINGTLPGFNDTMMQNPVVSNLVFTGNYSVNQSTFLEGTYGRSRNELAGCALAQSNTGPSFCQNAIPMNASSNRNNVGLGGLPMLYPDANKLNPSYYAFAGLDGMSPAPPAWVNGDFQMVPNFAYGNRVSNAPPNVPFPSYFNVNATQDLSISLTKVLGRHTFKTGYYNTHSYKAEQATGTASFGSISFQQDTVGTNPCDTSYGFANAAMGCFSSFTQAAKYVEGNYVYDNREAYIQDNWKINRKLTLDYGVRFVHQAPQYDELGQAANFLPEKWAIGSAPVLYKPFCAVTVAPGAACPAASLQAVNPVTGVPLGPNTSTAIATLVPGSGSITNGLFLGGQGIVDTTYTFPALGLAPRVGAAWDVSGTQKLVLRGSGGIFYDRPFGNSVISMAGNPPTSSQVTLRYTNLQSIGTGGLKTQGAPALNTIQYEPKLPTSFQWNGGIQMTLPWAMAVDFEYVGQHSFNTVRTVNLNLVDFGAGFLPENQNTTLAASTIPGATALSTDLLRSYRGFGSINHRLFDGWRTYHSFQFSLTRRFQKGVAFGFNDTIALSDEAVVPARLQHDPVTGQYSFRADQADAQALLGNQLPSTHLFRANFTWDLPDLKSSDTTLKVIGYVINDWQLSGIWSANTAAPYTVGFSYQSGGGNVNLTGSPDYGARIRVVGDPGGGCNNSDMYRQFTLTAFQGPLSNSNGLESGNNYMKGCFQSALDLAIARNIRLGGTRNVQLRVDMFNAPNEARITGRNTTLAYTTTTDPVNLVAGSTPFDPNGVLLPNRVRPNQAGTGAVTTWQAARTIQAQIRFAF